MSANKENVPLNADVIQLEPLGGKGMTVEARLKCLEKNVAFLMSLTKQQDKVLQQIALEVLLNASSSNKNESVAESIEHENKIYVCNMWPNTTAAEMKTHFGEYGKIVDAAILNQFEKSSNGIVEYTDKQMAEAAVAVTHEMSGRRVFVKKSEPKHRSSAGGKSTDSRTSKGDRYYPY